MRKRIGRALRRTFQPGNIFKDICISFTVATILGLITIHHETWGRFASEASANFVSLLLCDSVIHYIRGSSQDE